METKFTISELFKRALINAKEQIWVLAGLFIGYVILSFTLSAFAMPMQHSIAGKTIVNLVSLVLSVIFNLGYVKNHFQTLDGIEPQFSAYGQESRKIFTYIIAAIIMSVIILIGFCLFIIPGIYLYIRLQFYTAFIVEEDAGAIESLKRSWQITQGNVGQLFLLFLTMLAIALVGCCLLFVGIFFAVPIIIMMYCETFRKLYTPLQNWKEA